MKKVKVQNLMRVVVAGSALLFSLSGGAALAAVNLTGVKAMVMNSILRSAIKADNVSNS